jgi:hypothetical protein
MKLTVKQESEMARAAGHKVFESDNICFYDHKNENNKCIRYSNGAGPCVECIHINNSRKTPVKIEKVRKRVPKNDPRAKLVDKLTRKLNLRKKILAKVKARVEWDIKVFKQAITAKKEKQLSLLAAHKQQVKQLQDALKEAVRLRDEAKR